MSGQKMNARLFDKVVVVTGAGSGIGRAIAERFAAEGASVVLAGRRAGPLTEVSREIESKRGRAHVVTCDVTSEEDVLRLVAETLSRYHRLDVLVNSAGAMAAANIEDTTSEQYDAVVDTNVKGVYLTCREAFRVMKAAGGGVILNMSSVAGKEAWAGLSLYSASKFAVVGLSRALADEGRAHGIRVSALCPGAVNTPMLANSGIPAAELMQPEDIAESALYLATLPKNAMVKELVLERRMAD